MEAAQQAATAVNTAKQGAQASAAALGEIKSAAEQAVAAIVNALDTFATAAAAGATTAEETESVTLAALDACATALDAAHHLGSPDPIGHTQQAQYEVQTALSHITAAKESTHTLQAAIKVIQSDLVEPLINAASEIENEVAGPMQTGAGALEKSHTHLQAIT